METAEVNSALGYGKPPWVFKGSALYQLHLVKAETARAFIPKEFKLVEAFGYTLGGFFLANYEDSPAGIFDELVVIAGIVWNPPTSCAWAARVLVNSEKACVHGRKDVGLPSQVANFTKLMFYFLHKAMAAPQNDTKKWMGPAVKISLPSFSGRTEYNPDLLKYSCQIECRLRAVPPAKVLGPSALSMDGELTSERSSSETDFATGDSRDYKRNLSISVMLSKPILALEFNCLEMKVEAPTVVPQ